MKTENLALLLTAGLVTYLLVEKRKDQNKILALNNANRELAFKGNQLLGIAQQQSDKINQMNDELKKMIESKENLSREIKDNLNKLINDFEKLDKDISTELISISSLIEINEKPKALFSIAKIIENLLKKLYDEKLNFSKLIDKAKETKLITSEECHFIHGIREIRNKEAHEINVKVESYLTASSFMIGIGIISKIKTIANNV